jgi:hypothetical protein
MEHQRFGKDGENMKDLFEDMGKNKNNGWINCEFRLPEKGEKCLIMVEYNGVLGMYGTYERKGYIGNDGKWCGKGIGLGTVLAWKPLPKPYTESEEE